MENFKTIKEDVTAEIEEKRSKFIANVFYVENTIQADERIKQIKKKYHDARHNCFAYIINENEMTVKRFSDDGEPSGTAGGPILNVIEKNNLYNVLIVVTRYFGGILLGAGGLVRAYTESAVKALENVQFIYKEKGYEAEVVISYQELDKFKYYCEKNNIKIVNSEYGENVRYIIELAENEKNKFLENFNYDEKVPNILKFNILREKYVWQM